MCFAISDHSNERVAKRAFTLVELLVVLAIIGVLAALLLPAMARAKAKAQSTACLGNLKQLGLAFQLYLDDNQNTFPTAAHRSAVGAQPEDWIWWQVTGETMRDAHASSIAPYLGGFDTRYFRCPSDQDALDREETWRTTHQEFYTFSYSLNAFSNEGMASFISRDRSTILLNKQGAIVNPSLKIMLAEEKGSSQDGPGSAFVNDGAWQPLGYPLTSRHAGLANVTFADMHVETVSRSFADSSHPEHFDPMR